MKALIIIDMWDEYHAGHTRFQNLIEQTVNRLINLIGRWDGPVVLACYNTYKDENNPAEFGKPEHSKGFPWKGPNSLLLYNVNLKDKNLVSWDTDEILNFLDDNSVTHIYYAGCSYPGCIEARPIGADSELMKKYKEVIIVDCVVNLMSNGYNDYEIIHDAYRHALKNDRHRIVTSDTL